MLISVSILGIEQNRKRKIRDLNKSNADYLHLDIMDGVFVTNKTERFNHIKHLMSYNNRSLDIHLMVKNIIEYVDMYKQLQPTYLTFHVEATDNPLTMIDYIKNNNVKVGIAISPDTPIDKIADYLSLVDLVLVMTVEPGYGGQEFIEDVTKKIAMLKQLREQYQYNYVIEVDGGVNNITASKCKDADILVLGKYVTSSDDFEKKVNNIKYMFLN